MGLINQLKEFDLTPHFIVASTSLALIYFGYCCYKIYPFRKICLYELDDPNKFDLTIIRDVLVRTLLLGVALFMICAILFFGLTGEWLIPYKSIGTRVIVSIGGIYFLWYVVTAHLNYINVEINKRKEIRKKNGDK